MKKTKILTVLGVLLTMGITACGGANSGDVKSSDEPTTVSSDDKPTHEHQAGSEWKSDANEHWHVCSVEGCPTPNAKMDKAAHTWGAPDVKKAATCEEAGEQEVACTVCGFKKTEVLPAGHAYGEAATVAAKGEGYVGYTKAVCSKDGAIKLDIRALDGTLASGSSIKSGTAEGYFKLSSNNNSISWKFNLELSEGKTGAMGMVYTRGFMDAWSSNSSKAYGVYSTSHTNTRPEGNFDFTVNGNLVDKTAYMSMTFDELTAGGEDSSSVGENYSPIALVPVGEAVLNSGDNELVYKRTGSYNLVISDLVLVVKEFTHEHTAAEAWSSDDTQHWHVCTAVGCPVEGGYKMDAANHTFGEWVENKAATCKEAGERQHTCSVCGKVVKEEIAKLAHSYGEAYDVVPATCEAAGSQKKKCSVCEDVITEVLPKLAHTFGDVVDTYAAGEGYIATSAYNCSVCNKSALRWSALDYDTTLSSTDLDKQSTYVRFASGKVENPVTDGVAAEGTGSHIIYNVNVSEAVAKAGLSFKIKNTGGSGWGSSATAPVFNKISGDSANGFSKQGDEFVDTGKRYGLKVNDVEYFLGDDAYGNQSSVTAWFDWPVEFPLKAGVNKIDVFAYAGYRAQLMEFQVTGLPHVTPSHIHNGDATWLNDENNHWHACTGEGCPLTDGIYDKAAHDWNDVVVTTAATCTTDGAGTKTCKVCGKTVEVVLPAGHSYAKASANNSDGKNVDTYECSVCHDKYEAIKVSDGTVSAGKIGSDGKMDNGTVVTWKMPVKAVGNVQILISIKMSSSSHSSQSFDPTKYALKVGGVAQTLVLESGKTYGEIGLTTSDKYFTLAEYTVTEADVTAGEISIEFDHNNSSYRLLFAGELRVQF